MLGKLPRAEPKLSGPTASEESDVNRPEMEGVDCTTLEPHEQSGSERDNMAEKVKG